VHPNNLAQLVTVVAFVVALLALVTFVIGFAVTSRGDWRRTREGRHLVVFRSGIAALLGVSLVNAIVGRYAGEDVLGAAVVIWVAASAVNGCVLMFRAQARRRRLKRAQKAQART
jgi:glucose uptake protein GlcU